jgi:hypothetical protein
MTEAAMRTEPNKEEAAATRAAQRLPHNGAVVCWDRNLRKWAVVDCQGNDVGYRHALNRAMEFARTLPGEPYVPEVSPPINRSPRGTFVDSHGGVPSGRPIEEASAAFDYPKPARVRDPFAESRAKSQRQYRAHDLHRAHKL